MNQRIKDMIPFAVKIEDTNKSKKVIDWFNKHYNTRYRGSSTYYKVDAPFTKTNGHSPPSCQILTESEFLELLEDLPEPQQYLYNKPHPLEFPTTQLSDLPEKGEIIEVWDNEANLAEYVFYAYDSELKYPYLVVTHDGQILSFKHFARLPKIQISQSEINRLGMEAAAKMNNVDVSKIEIV